MSNSGDMAPGAVLARTREEMGVTQREVSDALNLPVSTVAAIEEGDKSRLPALVFTRGYVRAYAKLLELDAEPLVAALGDVDDGQVAAPQDSGDEGEQEKRVSTDDFLPPGLDAQHWLQPRNLAVGGGALLIVVVLVAVLMGGDDSVEPESGAARIAAQSTSAAQTDAEPSPLEPAATELSAADPAAVADVEAVDIDPRQTELTPRADTPPPADRVAQTAATAVTQPESSVADTAPSGPIAVAVPDSLPDRQDNARRLTATGNDRLALLFTEDCWVEIKDTADNSLFGDLGRAGQELEFVGAGPFRVLLGYAPGVLLKYNGEPIALTPHTRNNVASLVLGQ